MTLLLDRPTLRPGVGFRIEAGGIDLDYRDQGCLIDVAPELTDAMRSLMTCLEEGGRTLEEIEARIPELKALLGELLLDLDRLGLLEDSVAKTGNLYKTGRRFYRELRRFATTVQRRHARSEFYRALVEERATREQVIGYAFEYFHLVRRAPAIIATALGNLDKDESVRILMRFLESERDHDAMLIASLEAVGFERATVERTVPLPATFSLYAALNVYARQHPLSFKSILFLFEESSPEFHRAFMAHCERLELPADFWRPIIRHSEVNEGAAHGDITRDLLELVDVVSLEEETVVLRHLHVTIESMIWQERQILSHYGQKEGAVPRLVE